VGGGDASGEQCLPGGAEPFDAVELTPQVTSGAPADRVWVQRREQLGELSPDPNHCLVHAFDSNARL
jgi:hypothetical protein